MMIGNHSSDFGSRMEPCFIVGLLGTLLISYCLFKAIYGLYFHPLHNIPGPWYAAVSRAPYIRNHINGEITRYLQDLHTKYGEIVRYSPNEISVISGETAWQDIYGFRTGASKNSGSFEKDSTWYPPGLDNVRSLTSAPGKAHGRQRRIISHAFSTQALKEQEYIIQRYADLLIERLREVAVITEDPLDLCKWYNWTTFDIIGHLIFGEPFGCLAAQATHEYVGMILNNIRGFRYHYVKCYWPWTKYLGSLFIDKGLLLRRLEFLHWVKDRTHQRMESLTERPDLMNSILAHKDAQGDKGGISNPEIVANSSTFLTAGTETTATTLSAVTYLLLKHPHLLEKVVAEIRDCFKSQKEITVEAVNNNLPYMVACLTETLRYMPPVPAGFVRKVPGTGAHVSGYHIPGGCNASISVTQHAAYRSPRNFKDPDSFIPERWLDGPAYAADKKTVFQPFSFGPRNCIGKNLAYAEMRLIMAKVLFEFDLELDPKSADWDKNMKVFLLWDKPELLVKLKPLQRMKVQEALVTGGT
ncbi:putative P450 monooxygenase [Aureobasidium pullulans]|uniref:Putative P450 monooxygenase n=1 Tax=Aureobasidium pullulans TaxID=5580 RepID=A0A4S9JJ58_AURPU|nr:putative P450 monooxygenase [Aureobasidium pullulans]